MLRKWFSDLCISRRNKNSHAKPSMLVQNIVHSSLHGARLRWGIDASIGGLMGGGFDLVRALDDAQNMKWSISKKDAW
jgi:hypothetical protein